MLRHCLAFLAGAYALTLAPALPGDAVLAGTAVVAACAAAWRPARGAAACLAGALLLGYAAQAALERRLPPEQSGTDFTFTSEIIDFTQVNAVSLRLLVAPDADAGLPPRLRLSWYDAPAIPRLGERWEFTARLRPPRGYANPGGFDYAGWLHRQRVGATGYVRSGTAVAGTLPPVAALRRAFVARVDALLPPDEAAAVLLAITVGARHRIERAAWDRYAATGTTHLMAISGLHVGLAAAAAFAFVRLWLALVLPPANVRAAALVCALVTAAAYALLAGFAVPARRALLMAALLTAALLLRRTPSRSRIPALACLAIAICDPLALLAPGFKLSFAAVAVLLWCAAQATPEVRGGRVGRALHYLRGLGSLQLALLFGLLPLTALLFARVAWLAPLANALVLPIFSLVTVPAALLGMAAGGPLAIVGDAALWLCWSSLRGILALLARLAALPGAALPLAAPAGLALVTLCLTALGALLPAGAPGRRLAWPALLATLLYRPLPPPHGCFDLHVLDVGQGLAAVVQSRRQVVVFDTGPAFRGGGDTGQLVLLPFLASRGIDTVDLVVVSHADQDHAGGLASLVAGVRVRQVLAGEPGPLDGAPQFPCHSGTAWQRDGIDFAVLHPDAGAQRDGNNASCVLEVAAGAHRALLTGDIERAAERQLVARGRLQTSDVVVVPHHGSRTSSGAAFIDALSARHAVVAAGHGNRWGFPKADVVARWQAAGAEVATTAASGALTYRVCSDGGVAGVVHWRERARRYWHDRAR